MPHNNPDQVGCRLCNQVFMGTQALIAHIESHIAHEEIAIRSLNSPNHINSQKGQVSHRFPPTLPMPMPLQETINFANSKIFQSPPQPTRMPQPRRNPFFSVAHVGSSQPIRQMLFPPQLPIPQAQWKPEEYPNDGTKAYIKQLEKPIKKIDFIDLVGMDDDNSDVQTLNLALKL